MIWGILHILAKAVGRCLQLLTVQCFYKLLQLTETVCWDKLLQTRRAQHRLTHLRHFHHTSWQPDFAGKGEYKRSTWSIEKVIFAVLEVSFWALTAVVKFPWKFLTLIFAVLLPFLE